MFVESAQSCDPADLNALTRQCHGPSDGRERGGVAAPKDGEVQPVGIGQHCGRQRWRCHIVSDDDARQSFFVEAFDERALCPFVRRHTQTGSHQQLVRSQPVPGIEFRGVRPHDPSIESSRAGNGSTPELIHRDEVTDGQSRHCPPSRLAAGTGFAVMGGTWRQPSAAADPAGDQRHPEVGDVGGALHTSAGQALDPAKPVAECLTVDHQLFRGCRPVAIHREKDIESLDEVTVIRRVVIDQLAQNCARRKIRFGHRGGKKQWRRGRILRRGRRRPLGRPRAPTGPDEHCRAPVDSSRSVPTCPSNRCGGRADPQLGPRRHSRSSGSPPHPPSTTGTRAHGPR